MTQPAEDFQPISKTKRKQQMDELQALGEELVAQPADRLRKLDLPEDLREALAAAQRMGRRDEARRRQMQYIGRLMREVEAEPIRAALASARGESAEAVAALHRIERLRQEILDNEAELGNIASRHPGADLQHLRALRRAALKEQEQGKPPRSFRALFQALKELEAGEVGDESTPDPLAE